MLALALLSGCDDVSNEQVALIPEAWPSAPLVPTAVPSGSASTAPVASASNAVRPVPPDIVKSARRVAELQNQLRSLGDILDFTVPPDRPKVPLAAQRVVRQLQVTALEVITAYLPIALDAATTDPLAAAFVAADVAWIHDWDTFPGLGALWASLSPAAGHQDRWFVLLHIDLGHGGDSSLALFERREGSLRLALVDRTPVVKSVRDVRFARTWTISPPDAQDAYYVVTGWTNPWVASCWRDMRFHVLAPGRDPWAPRRLARSTAPTYWCNGWSFDATATGFSLDYDGHDDVETIRARRQRWVRRGDRFVELDDRPRRPRRVLP